MKRKRKRERNGGKRERKRKKRKGVSREWIRRDGHIENGGNKTEGKERRKEGHGEEGGGVANAGKEGEVHMLERETRYILDSDEAPFIRERIEGKEMRVRGNERENMENEVSG